MRSTSFDEFQLEANRTSSDFLRHQTSADDRATLLQVPHVQVGQRSRSVESSSIDSSAASYLEVPRRFQRRRSSNSKSPLVCVHCQCVEEYERSMQNDQHNIIGQSEAISFSSSDSSNSASDDDDDDDNDSNDQQKYENLLTIPPTSPCNIKFSLSPTSTDFPTFPLSSSAFDSPTEAAPPDSLSSNIDVESPVFNAQPPLRTRRRSISRQEAIFIEPTGTSLENVSDAALDSKCADSIKDTNQTEDKNIENFKLKSDFVQDFYLAVPDADLKRDRAASVDSSFSKLSSNGKTEELQPQIDGFALTVPSSAVRSRSVDIVLPTNEQERYKALALAGPSMSKRYVESHDDS